MNKLIKTMLVTAMVVAGVGVALADPPTTIASKEYVDSNFAERPKAKTAADVPVDKGYTIMFASPDFPETYTDNGINVSAGDIENVLKSGITGEDVTQIGTNATDISDIRNTISSLNEGVSGSLEKPTGNGFVTISNGAVSAGDVSINGTNLHTGNNELGDLGIQAELKTDTDSHITLGAPDSTGKVAIDTTGLQTALELNQLNAVNSGITAEKVEQISTNTGNITANAAAIGNKLNKPEGTTAGVLHGTGGQAATSVSGVTEEELDTALQGKISSIESKAVISAEDATKPAENDLLTVTADGKTIVKAGAIITNANIAANADIAQSKVNGLSGLAEKVGTGDLGRSDGTFSATGDNSGRINNLTAAANTLIPAGTCANGRDCVAVWTGSMFELQPITNNSDRPPANPTE